MLFYGKAQMAYYKRITFIMATIKFKTFYEANFFAKKMASDQCVSSSIKRVNEGFLVEGNFRVSQNDVFIPPRHVAPSISVVKNKTISSKKANNPPSINASKSLQNSHLTEDQKAAILESKENKERDKNPYLIKKS